ncbi:protein of unknown function [uncultured Woeseiaceae bacterium]|uniref:Uncharacterized protein n=1 Tax=uncultured Woeseiaceae bacterium TaxID=1983305 RepID=A0A7D9D425_9GAMM|nr:protein of unknown function [uncultured Woeseiaceae bacterium]
MVEATPTIPNEIRLSSTDGCRTESLGISDFRGSAFHMTADRSKGVIVWSEEVIDNLADVVWRLDFTVDVSVNPDGELDLGAPVQILPLVGEEAAPGDSLGHGSLDIWGDATHDSLYLTVLRMRSIKSGPDAGGKFREALIYDLNDLTGNLAGPAPDERLLFHLSFGPGEEDKYGDWLDADPMNLQDCRTVLYPQFVPTCYLPEALRFNPSGTRLYLERGLSRDLLDPDDDPWHTVMRIKTDDMAAGLALADWDLAGPELVYTGTNTNDRDRPGGDVPGGMVPRPDDDVAVLPSPEYIAVVQDTDGSRRTSFASILNADQCASDLAPYAGGNLEGPPDLWRSCIDNGQFLAGSFPGTGDSWQSPEALLKSSFQDPEFDIHRVYVTGALAGTEQLMIETARFGDTGN